MALSAQQTSDITKQYDPLRQKAQQQEATNLQGQKDALARRAAQLGGGPSGAFIKQEGVASDASAQRLQAANEGINAQQQGAINQAADVQAGREFTTSERQASQAFASGESALQRKYQTGEREAGQEFTTGERQSGQEFAGTQTDKTIQAAKDAQDKQIASAEKMGQISADQAKAALAQNQAQYESDLNENKKTNAINAVISGYNSKISPQAMGDLLKSLGIDIGSVPGLTQASAANPDASGIAKTAGSVADVGTSGAGGGGPGGGMVGGLGGATQKLKSILNTKSW